MWVRGLVSSVGAGCGQEWGWVCGWSGVVVTGWVCIFLFCGVGLL